MTLYLRHLLCPAHRPRHICSEISFLGTLLRESYFIFNHTETTTWRRPHKDAMLLLAPRPVGQQGHEQPDGLACYSRGASPGHPFHRARPSCDRLPAWQWLWRIALMLCPRTATRKLPADTRPPACAHASHPPIHADGHKWKLPPPATRAQVHEFVGPRPRSTLSSCPGGGARDGRAAAHAERRGLLSNSGMMRISTVRASPRSASFAVRSPVPCAFDACIDPRS